MGKNIVREHKHVIIRAYVDFPPKDPMILSEWCKNVISSVDMRIINSPSVYYSDMVGNRGLTATAILDFSHMAIHVWDECYPAMIEFDLFSCKNFDTEVVLKKLDEFMLRSYSITVLNRDEFDKNQIVWK